MPTIRLPAFPLQPASVSLIALTRSDTNALPVGVTLPIAFAQQGDGSWSASFSDPGSLPPSYAYTYQQTYSDGSIGQSDGNKLVILPKGVYCTIGDVRREMGTQNEQTAADPDQAGIAQAILVAEQDALDFHVRYIHFRAKIYNIPTPISVSDPDIQGILEEIAAKLSAWKVYRIRGLQDKADAFQDKYKWAVDQLENLFASNLMQDNAAPVAVAASVDPAGNPVAPNNLWPRPKWNDFYWGW